MFPANDGIDLTDPARARKYIKDFGPRLLGKAVTYVATSEGRLIHFKTMDDEDAVWVAHQLRGMEEEAAKRSTPPHGPKATGN